MCGTKTHTHAIAERHRANAQLELYSHNYFGSVVSLCFLMIKYCSSWEGPGRRTCSRTRTSQWTCHSFSNTHMTFRQTATRSKENLIVFYEKKTKWNIRSYYFISLFSRIYKTSMFSCFCFYGILFLQAKDNDNMKSDGYISAGNGTRTSIRTDWRSGLLRSLNWEKQRTWTALVYTWMYLCLLT